MHVLRNISLSAKIIVLLTACIMFFGTCIENEKKKIPVDDNVDMQAVLERPDYDLYVGSERCASCHNDISQKHSTTSHYLSTIAATEQTIKGSFRKGSNIFHYNPELFIEMQKRDSGLFQVVYYKGEEKLAIPFDMIIGSGTKGQSFMYWRDNRLYQMPLTYYSIAGQWANSPGFPSRVQFDRPITSRCLECHSTFADVISPFEKQPEEFNRKKIIAGIGCEKCHGPGKEHSRFHEQHPRDTTPRFIVNPASLSRQQQLDLCALCHGGRKEQIQPSFSFIAGDTLDLFFKRGNNSFGIADVHGNQLALLASSKCFKMSPDMTCSTCHGPHANERGRLTLFSERCMNCHSTPHKPIPGQKISASSISSNCIDCHMPAKPSNSIVLMTDAGQLSAAKFRTHLIDIYNNNSADSAAKSSGN